VSGHSAGAKGASRRRQRARARARLGARTSEPLVPSAGGAAISLTSSSKSPPLATAHLYVVGAEPRTKLVKRKLCSCEPPRPALKWSVRASAAGIESSSSLCTKTPSSGAESVSVPSLRPFTSGRQPSSSSAEPCAPTSSDDGTATSARSHATANVTGAPSGLSTSSACETSARTAPTSANVLASAGGVAFTTSAYETYSAVRSLVKVTSALLVPSRCA
jgi:hypothetical protein